MGKFPYIFKLGQNWALLSLGLILTGVTPNSAVAAKYCGVETDINEMAYMCAEATDKKNTYVGKANNKDVFFDCETNHFVSGDSPCTDVLTNKDFITLRKEIKKVDTRSADDKAIDKSILASCLEFKRLGTTPPAACEDIIKNASKESSGVKPYHYNPKLTAAQNRAAQSKADALAAKEKFKRTKKESALANKVDRWKDKRSATDPEKGLSSKKGQELSASAKNYKDAKGSAKTASNDLAGKYKELTPQQKINFDKYNKMSPSQQKKYKDDPNFQDISDAVDYKAKYDKANKDLSSATSELKKDLPIGHKKDYDAAANQVTAVTDNPKAMSKSELKEQKKLDKADSKAKNKAARQDDRAARRQAEKDSYNADQCGNFGGFGCEVSDGINTAVEAAVKATDMAGGAAISEAGTKEAMELAGKGNAVKQSEIYRSRAAMQKETAKKVDLTHIGYASGAAAQLGTSLAHFFSKAAVSSHENEVVARNNGLVAHLTQQKTAGGPCSIPDDDGGSEIIDCSTVGDVIAQLNADTQIQQENHQKELDDQKAKGISQLAQMASTASNSVKAAFTAAELRQQAAMNEKLANISEQTEGQTPFGFSWNPQQQGDEEGSGDPAPYQSPGGETMAANTETPNTSLGDGMAGLPNGNLGDQTDGGPLAGQYQNGTGPVGGGGGGLSGSGAGGTSASSGGGGGDQPGAPKAAKIGRYAAGEGTGAVKRGGGFSPSVGGMGGISDLLKKLMGQAVDDKKKENEKAVAFEADRMPSSDEASRVIPRNGNIFKSIHQRYQLKSKEGAVTFADKNG